MPDLISPKTNQAFQGIISVLYSGYFGLTFYLGSSLLSTVLDFSKTTNYDIIKTIHQDDFLRLMILGALSIYILEDYIGMTLASSEYKYRNYLWRFVLDVYIGGVMLGSVFLLFKGHRSFLILFSLAHLLSFAWAILLNREYSLNKYYFRPLWTSHLFGSALFAYLFWQSHVNDWQCGPILFRRFFLYWGIWYMVAVASIKYSPPAGDEISKHQYPILGRPFKLVAAIPAFALIVVFKALLSIIKFFFPEILFRRRH